MSKQAGVAPIAIIIAVVVVLLAGGGYFLASKSGSLPSSVPGLPGGISLNPDCKHNDPDLCKFLNNANSIKDYSIKGVYTAPQVKSESLFEISGEDKFHMVTSENGKESYNVITLGDTTYTKDYIDNKWWKQKATKQVEDIKNQSEFKVTTDSKPEEDKTTYKSMGKEACGSKQCFKYQQINPDMKDAVEYIWFDDKEYLVRRQRVEAAGTVSESEFSYGKISINEPSPVKEGSSESAAFPSGITPGFSKEELKVIQEESQKTIDSQPVDYTIQPIIDSVQSDTSQE
ncbi:MAG: hypothetical protein WCV81_00335 [Microgenomates group bacterium]